MLLSLLIFQLRSPLYAIVALFSGVTAVFLALALPGNLYVIIAPVVAASAGLFLSRRYPDPQKTGESS
jgi:hypothetical protein